MAEKFPNDADKTSCPYNKREKINKHQGNDTNKELPSESSESEMNSLVILEKLVSKFKSGDTAFVNLVDDLCNIYNDKNTKKQKLKLEIIEKLILNLAQADYEEMETLKNIFKKNIFLNQSIKKMFVDEKDILSLYPEGEFLLGQLKKNGVNTLVYLRTALNNPFDIKLRRNEAMFLSKLDHPNIYNMLGITRNFNTIVFEIDGYTNLRRLLLQREFSSNSRKVIDMLIKIAETMAYIHSQDILHNTLNTNCIRIKNENIKIDRFSYAGYMEDSKIETNSREAFFAICYSAAPESLNNDIYTTKTDVWAMGILCFEVFFYLSVPLIIVPLEIAMLPVLDDIQRGFCKLNRPPKCPKPLFTYMTEKLLNLDPDERPNFTEIVTVLQDIRRKC